MKQVKLAAAAPQDIVVDGKLPSRKIVVASEKVRLTTDWIEREKIDAVVVRSCGATEVFPPEDADGIILSPVPCVLSRLRE